MRILVDMNLSPQWVPYLRKQGHDAIHWSDLGERDSPASELMTWASENKAIIFTNDLDFSAILAASGAGEPSVLQLRTQNLLPFAVGDVVLNLLNQFRVELADGILISADVHQARVRLLPLK